MNSGSSSPLDRPRSTIHAADESFLGGSSGGAMGSRVLGGLAFASLTALAPAAENEPRAPSDLLLFLLLGLTNLPPRGAVEKMDRELHPRALVMNKGLGWARAIEPEDWSASELTHVELGAALARTVVEGRPGVTVGLIPCAFGGKTLADWMPGTALYQATVERARIAQKDGKLAGMLWFQGSTSEDPAQAADYAKRFASMIAQLRLDLGVKYVPVIVSELKLGAQCAALATPLAEVPQQVIPCFFISMEGVQGANGGTRLDSNTLWNFSEKFTQAWMDLAQP
jgi:hypothetical protein